MDNESRNIPRDDAERNSSDDKDVSIEGPLVSMPVLIDEPVGTPEYDTSHPHKGERDKLKLGKKHRFGEMIVEQMIKVLAFSAFAAIILIFVFVFREASPMFFGGSKPHSGSTSTSTSTSQQQETYGEPSSSNTTTNGGAIQQ